MICPKCGAENPKEAIHCSLCHAVFGKEYSLKDYDDPSTGSDPKTKDVKIRCPNCNTIGPYAATFCGRCGFAFDDRDVLMVGEAEAAAAIESERKKEGLEQGEETVIEFTDGVQGADVIRKIEASFSGGFKPRIRARGREQVAHTIKLLTALSEDYASKGRQLWFASSFVESRTILHLDDLEIEILIVLT